MVAVGGGAGAHTNAALSRAKPRIEAALSSIACSLSSFAPETSHRHHSKDAQVELEWDLVLDLSRFVPETSNRPLKTLNIQTVHRAVPDPTSRSFKTAAPEPVNDREPTEMMSCMLRLNKAVVQGVIVSGDAGQGHEAGAGAAHGAATRGLGGSGKGR